MACAHVGIRIRIIIMLIIRIRNITAAGNRTPGRRAAGMPHPTARLAQLRIKQDASFNSPGNAGNNGPGTIAALLVVLVLGILP